MVKHTQTVNRQKTTNCLSVFDHFVGLALKGLNIILESILGVSHILFAINLFHVIDLFLYLLKKFENLQFSDDFRGYRNRDNWDEMG